MSYILPQDKTPEVRLWKIVGKKLEEIQKPQLDLEERLENWIESDISIIDPSIMIISRQLETDYGGVIDLLCIDEKGDLVIVELKRDKTPRDITAQVLDYASWVKHLSPDKVQSIAESYLDESFEDAYSNKFNQELPDSINEEHRMLVVGTRIDPNSRRIISYLSETYGVNINAVTFNYFKDNGQELLARTFLIEQEKIQRSTHSGSKRLPNLSFEQLQAIADEHGVGEIYSYLFKELQGYFDAVNRTRSSISFTGEYRTIQRAAIFNLIPTESDSQNGLSWQVYLLRFSEYFDISKEEALEVIPSERETWSYGVPSDDSRYEEYSGFKGLVKLEEAREFVAKLMEVKKQVYASA